MTVCLCVFVQEEDEVYVFIDSSSSHETSMLLAIDKWVPEVLG